ncbi:N-acetylglucosamine-6-phosphate deacetylase [Nocardiopsis sp. JB363]|uniref:N-acetylglucosamine-6-phosphate deacetylase n=1 Tax=Nocardiopsis sp. JB363 TaxID=1434837 RepID=UPI00097B73C7|nr:N-acetylglucosamine-6-phosphate deacetylase [Nocardiopsis sp. JB363]SIO91403.1 N-acetylglucosamine-6-phosphate deacetylase [Nocardiopsis sp. JB363]
MSDLPSVDGVGGGLGGVDADDVLIHSVSLVDEGVRLDDAWIAFRNGRVHARGRGGGWRERTARAMRDGTGAILTPGFIDIHCHGAAGAGFDDPEAQADALDDALTEHAAHGTTRLVLSLVSAPIPRITNRLEALHEYVALRPTVLGVHLEGPFLADSHCGAHDPAHLADPDPASVDALLRAGRGNIRQVTIAPELPGALSAIDTLVREGVAVAVGHTGADVDVVRDAFAAGASILTHTFNGMRGLHHRAPGPIAAAVESGATLEVIADGVHVDPMMIGFLHALAPGRIALVTDAMAATGCEDGDYVLGSLPVRVRDGVVRLRDGGSIAGSTLTTATALRIATTRSGMSLPEAVASLTTIPARAIGRPELGTLRVGAASDAVLMDEELRVRAVWAEGREMPRPA